MNKKFLYRIIGAISSALIIVSVFVPFVKVVGFSQSIWQEFSEKTMYLPILIIVFGAIGVIFFSLNFKIEFSYSTTGGILFYVVMRTIDVMNQGAFNTLSVGYYFMIIGAVLTGIMAFLCTKESNDSIDNMQMIESQTLSSNLMNQSMPIGNIPMQDVQIPEQNLNLNNPEILFENEIPNQNIEFNNQPQSINEAQFQSIPDLSIPVESSIPDVNTPSIPDIIEQPIQTYNEMPVSGINGIQQTIVEPSIPDVNLNSNQQINSMGPTPINNQISTPIVEQSQLNNTLQNGSQINMMNPNQNMQFNPVVNEFINSNSVMQSNQVQQSNFSVPSSNNFENSSTDIFGQPLNRG